MKTAIPGTARPASAPALDRLLAELRGLAELLPIRDAGLTAPMKG